MPGSGSVEPPVISTGVAIPVVDEDGVPYEDVAGTIEPDVHPHPRTDTVVRAAAARPSEGTDEAQPIEADGWAPTELPHEDVPAPHSAPASRTERRWSPRPESPAAAGTAPARALEADPARVACTAPQLRRFIKSRVYVPMHELRRRFAIDGGEDDVTPVDLGAGRVFLGLPEREASLVGELLRAGDVGYELSMDPIVPIVVGVYPMRPVSRG